MKKYILPTIMWLFSAFLAYVFIKAGLEKFDDTSGWSKAFTYWHFPVWFRVLIGVIEVVGAVLLLYPKTALYGVGALEVVMLGAMGTHLYHGEGIHEVFPVALLLIVGYLRYRKTEFKKSPQPT